MYGHLRTDCMGRQVGVLIFTAYFMNQQSTLNSTLNISHTRTHTHTLTHTHTHALSHTHTHTKEKNSHIGDYSFLVKKGEREEKMEERRERKKERQKETERERG